MTGDWAQAADRRAARPVAILSLVFDSAQPGTWTAARCWRAVLARDGELDGAFVYAVRSTRIYCRPSCPSRRPRRAGVRFFATPDAAEAGGYRACRRCRPRDVHESAALRRVRAACAFIAGRATRSISLAELASHVGASPFHFQRTFSKLVGLSPRAYQQALRARTFRSSLRGGAAPLDAALDAGYGSTSRVYGQKPTGGMTPAAYRRGGRGQTVTYTTVESPLGRLLVAGTARGVCAVKLADTDESLVADLRREYPDASIAGDARALQPWVRVLQALAAGHVPSRDLPLDVRATAFQWKVWRALQAIPVGEVRAYSEVARAIGRPTAVRAVAGACASNPVCLAVPCHRVVGKDGSLTGYRWGVERKRALLARERRTRSSG